MPIYSCVCELCGKKDTYFQKIENRNDTPECCGAQTTKVLDAPMGMVEYQPFVSPIDGTVIQNRDQFIEHNKRHNVVPASDFQGHKVDHAAESKARRRKHIDEALRRAANR